MKQRVRVLIADDQRSTRQGLKALLFFCSQIEVVGEAVDGQEAVQLAAAQHPDVVLMDVRMPVMDGLEATRRIKRQRPEVKIIALTMHARYRAKALAAGVDIFLLKGCATQVLLDAILTPGRDLLTTHSDGGIETVNGPRNLGRMDEPDAYGSVQGWCGDTMEIYLRLDGERIKEATFVTDGCEPSVACGNMLTMMVRGMLIKEAGEIRPKDLLAALDGLPEEDAHCAELAINTLRESIANSRAAGGAPSGKRKDDIFEMDGVA